MALENKLHITDSAELARVEERISKAKALELFETGLLDSFEVGTFAALQRFMDICSAISMTLPDSCARSTWPKAISALRR